jgi:transposase
MTRKDLRRLSGGTGAERRAALEEIRRRAVRLVVKGKRKPGKVAKLFDVSPKTVSRWVNEFRRRGDVALKSQRSTGRPPALSKRELARLRRTIVGKNPSQLNFGVLLWTLPIIQQLVARMFGKELHATTIARYLNDLGLTPQRPLRRASQRNEADIARWVAEEFPRIAADVRRKQAVLLFLDEAGVHENGPLGTTWGKKGTRPIVRVTGNRGKINVISAVSPSGHLWFRCYRDNLDADLFVEFLTALLHDIRGEIVLVMDSHPAHVAEEACVFYAERHPRLQVELLPKYAPELNPDEHVWGYLKGMFRRDPLQWGEKIAEAVEAAMNEMKAKKSLIRALFGHPDLQYVEDNLG